MLICSNVGKRLLSLFFDLLAKIIGATANHKQLPIKGLAKVRTCLALATLTLQIA
jgi:hypothetical protein